MVHCRYMFVTGVFDGHALWYIAGGFVTGVFDGHALWCIAGGFVAILMEEYLLWEVDTNGDHHDAMMKTMEKDGLWQLVEKTYVDNYVFGLQGVLVVFKVLQPCRTLTQAKQATA